MWLGKSLGICRLPRRILNAEALIGEMVLVRSGIVVGIGNWLVQTPLGAWPGLETQSRYEVPNDLRVESCQLQWLKVHFRAWGNGNWKPLKNYEKYVFYFTWKALFILKIIKFLFWHFGHVEQWPDSKGRFQHLWRHNLGNK